MPRSALVVLLLTLVVAVPGAVFGAMQFKDAVAAATAEQSPAERRADRLEKRRAAATSERAGQPSTQAADDAREQRRAERQQRPAERRERASGETTWRNDLKVSLYSALGGGLMLLAGAIYVPIRRLRNRHTREYGLYEVRLSMHDEAKEQDLEDMVEMIGNVIGGYPEDRAVNGRPYVAIELHYGPADHGMEWTLAVRCTRDAVAAVDAAISAAYPDVRVGFTFGNDPQPINGRLQTPGHVLRFRKARDFVYAISTDSDKASSPPIEAIAQAQVSVGTPSSVRIQLIAPGGGVEGIARARYRRHEQRQKNRGATIDGTLRPSTLHDFEMREAMRTQNRGMFWLELQVAAETREAANQIASALMARRGDNRLHRRLMVLRAPLYRKRFPDAYPPLLPSLSLRSLVSAAEVAHLLELPSARMKGVPVRRLALPRKPAAPDVLLTLDITAPRPPAS